MRSAQLIPALAACLVLAGCGSADGQEDPQSVGDVPITQRAIAAVSLEHLSPDTTARRATDTNDQGRKDARGADLFYNAGENTNGDLVRVLVTPDDDYACPEEIDYGTGCEERAVDGGTLIFQWTEGDAEDSSGIVEAVMVRDGERVHARWYVETGYLYGDPREEEDLAISIDDLEAVVQDPRLSMTTTPDVVDLGRALEKWESG